MDNGKNKIFNAWIKNINNNVASQTLKIQTKLRKHLLIFEDTTGLILMDEKDVINKRSEHCEGIYVQSQLSHDIKMLNDFNNSYSKIGDTQIFQGEYEETGRWVTGGNTQG